MADEGQRFSGPALGSIAAGGLLVFAGIKGYSLKTALQDVIKGQSPLTETQTSPITGSAASGAGSPAPGAPASGTEMQNLMYVAEYMTTQGYTDAAAAGIASCVAGESGGNPESQGSGGRGLIGWTPPGKLPDSAFTGNVPADLAAQSQAIIAYNNDQGQLLIAGLNAQTSPVSAAMYYSLHFERPLVPYSDVRPLIATQVYDTLQKGGTSSAPTG
jgi:hypothetical protein